MSSFQDLETWQCAMTLVESCYRFSAAFPKNESYGLASQMRRAAVSIPSNVAEGHCRRKAGANLNHVGIALGSHGELRTCIELARRLGYASADACSRLNDESDSVGRLLHGLHRSLEKRIVGAGAASPRTT